MDSLGYKKANKVSLIAVAISISIMAIYGCQRQAPARLEKINIALQEWVGYGLFYLAQEKGFCRDQGIELEFIDEKLDSARRDAFKAGMLDCEAGTIDLLISKIAQDTPLVAVMEMDHSFGADGIVAIDKINKLRDLCGRKISFARDDVGEAFLAYLFYESGLSLNDVVVVPRSPDKAAEAFLNDEADAAVTWEPWLSMALKRPKSHILFSTKDYPGVIIDTLNVRADIVKNNPGLVKKLMRAWFAALKYYRDNPMVASEIIAKHYKLTAQDYRKAVLGLKWLDYSAQITPEHRKEWADIFETLSEIKFKSGRINKKPPVKDTLNYTLLESLYENSQ